MEDRNITAFFQFLFDFKDALSLAYTPGVAQPCLEIQKDVNKSYDLTRRWNTVAVVTDGTAVLGLGDIGPEAGMPVMEGKCVLFKEFGGVDAIPLCVRSKDVDEIVKTVSLLAGSFGGINLEDISAPRCFEIEKKLKECCDIPIFHDDQHGTAVITLAGVINALKLVGKKLDEVKIVTSGAGAEISSRLIPPKDPARRLTVLTISSTSLLRTQSGIASTPPNSLKSTHLPSITGIPASGPISPSPSTAVPSVTTATVFQRLVRS